MENTYSIVTTNFNNSQYFSDFINSVVSDFKKQNQLDKLEVIIVDDCSTDDSVVKLTEIKRKYPNTIKLYVNTVNSGVSYSRNVGLAQATKEWICFFDIDDFVSTHFFKNLDTFISNSKIELGMIFLKVMLYFGPKSIQNHPLNYRFNTDTNLCKIGDYKEITQSSTTTIFRKRLIDCGAVKFDERIKTTFEDGKFELEFMLKNPNSYCAYFTDGAYFYRKKQNKNSVSTSGWKKKEKYTTDLVYGYDLLENYNATVYLQKKCLYEMFWFIKYLINKPVRSYVDPDDINGIFKRIFSNIPSELIKDYNKCGCWEFHRVGMLGRFKDEEPTTSYFYIEKFDQLKSTFIGYTLSYSDKLSPEIVLKSKNAEVNLSRKKRQVFSLFEKPFCYKNFYTGCITSDQKLVFRTKNGIQKIVFNKRVYADGISIRDLMTSKEVENKVPLKSRVIRSMLPLISCVSKLLGLDSSWLFMDRDTWADDSAEVLFKWVVTNGSGKENCIFAVNKNTHDYQRLKKLNMKVIPFGGIRYFLALNTCKYFISSQADSYQLRLQINKKFPRFKYIFLQHGVIKDNIANWLNAKKIDYFITSTFDEYRYVAGDGPFKFTTNEVKLIGLPRHDLLYDKSAQVKPMIVIMPTWRQSLSKTNGLSNEKVENPEFYKSEFALTWKTFLHSHVLENLANQGVDIVFCPHINLQLYMSWFEVPSWIRTFDVKKDGEIRELFRAAKLMITDSSSAAFEMAVDWNL